MSDYRMYILVNNDIKLQKGKLAGQVGHAIAVYFYKHFRSDSEHHQLIEDYMSHEQKKIILKAPQSTLEELERNGAIAIRDKGYTQIDANSLTCINLGIMDKSDVPEWIQSLKLVN